MSQTYCLERTSRPLNRGEKLKQSLVGYLGRDRAENLRVARVYRKEYWRRKYWTEKNPRSLQRVFLEHKSVHTWEETTWVQRKSHPKEIEEIEPIMHIVLRIMLVTISQSWKLLILGELSRVHRRVFVPLVRNK